MIKVEVRLYATLKRYLKRMRQNEALLLNLKKGGTLLALYKSLDMPREEVKIAMVNGRAQNNDYILSDGDRIALFPAAAGG